MTKTNQNAIGAQYDELQAQIDGDLDDANETPLYIRRRVSVDRARAGKVVLSN